MFIEFTSVRAHLRVRMQPSSIQHVLRRLGTWLGSQRLPQAGTQPDWARVPGRVWRRHSMLLVSLHERHAGLRHD